MPSAFFTVITVYLLFNDVWHYILSWSAAYSMLLMVISSNIGNIVFAVMGSVDYNSQSESQIPFYSSIVTLILIFAICIIFHNKSRTFSDYIHTLSFKDSIIIFLVSITDFMLSGISMLFFNHSINLLGRRLMVLAIFIMIIMSIVIVILYFRLRRYNEVLKQNDIINRELLELEKTHYLELRDKNMDLREFRHDYNQHIIALQALSESRDYEALYNYISTLNKKHEQIHYISTNNVVADAIINYHYATKNENTEFTVDGKFSSELFITESDLCIILSNLVKNAIEAVDRLPEESPHKIHINLFSNNETIHIKVYNSSLEPVSSGTSKNDKLNHGFGLKNIKSVVERYNGSVDFSYDKGYYAANVQIKREK